MTEGHHVNIPDTDAACFDYQLLIFLYINTVGRYPDHQHDHASESLTQ